MNFKPWVISQFFLLAAGASFVALAAQQSLGFSLGKKGLDFPVAGVGYSSTDWGSLVELDDGVGDPRGVSSFLSNRPANVAGIRLKLGVGSARCNRLKTASQQGQSFARAVVQFSDGSQVHRFSIRDAKLDSVQCGGGLGRVEVNGSRITYDGSVPK